MSVAAAPSRVRPASEEGRRGFRSDIQALRAVAIAVVVLNHLWPTRFGGGYVGVDVFFVISGYLITAHLLSEILRTGRVRLGRFYARRIRRLLPAALLVLAVSAVLVFAFLPYSRWLRNAAEIAASAAYVENWLLAILSVDYSAVNQSAGIAQHYWSLSVEEQFYIVWPLLLLASAVWASRRQGIVRRTVLIVVAGVAAASLAASVLYTAAAPSQAYFATFTRAWEFAAGALLALLPAARAIPARAANILALAGFAAIVWSVFAYGSTTPFPGIAALVPVLGTVAIIAAGTGNPHLWHAKVTATPPVQWLGNVSYSLYLWHWPLIVVAPFALRSELTGPTRIGVLAAALVLAWLTKIFVEDRGQRWSRWATSTRLSFLLMLVGMAVVAALAASLAIGQQSRAAADVPPVVQPAVACSGPLALQDSTCATPFGPATDSIMTAKNEYFYWPPECGEAVAHPGYADVKTTTCDFSDATPGEEVWLVGDSHAQQWQGAVFDLARQNGWQVTVSYFAGCPAADVAFRGFRIPWSDSDIELCRTWSRNVSSAIADAAPEFVFTSMAARHHLVDDGSGRPAIAQFVDGLHADWKRWTSAGSRVVVLGDPPLNGEVRDADCASVNASDPAVCARPQTDAQPTDPLIVAATTGDLPDVVAVDLTSSFCDGTLCYAVVGGVPVYYDADHLNLEYVRMLAPAIASVIGVAFESTRP